MTRFARAKGSKSSNERLPEDATSWQEMKQQMVQKKQEAEDSKKQKQFEEQRRNNYKNFLNECENEKQDTWAEFEENNEKSGKKKQKILETNGNKCDDDDAPIEVSAKIEPKSIVVKKKKAKKGKVIIPAIVKKNDGEREETEAKTEENNVEEPKENDKLTKLGDKNKKVLETKKDDAEKPKKNKKKKQKVKKPESEQTEIDKLKIKRSKEKKLRQLENRKLKKAEREKAQQEAETTNGVAPETTNGVAPEAPKPRQFTPNNPHQNQHTPNSQKRKQKSDNNEDHKRRKPAVESVSMMINGNEVKISYFDGFPIKSEDATRLHQLKKQMISKGISRSEIQTALKLERRKAEKALTREKKKVCFNCRKSGHNLSECPNLNENATQETIGSGICFKCGSTEHTHFECKVVRDDNFKYATCFICKEQGHISRQCPDNNRGLYPKGGACKVCGDVTHLKKDCLKYQMQQEALTMTADTIKFDDIEDLEGGTKPRSSVSSKPNKVVKF